MAASLTLIVVGIVLLSGHWNAGYAIACIVAGAVWWHASEHARRIRLASARSASRRMQGVRKALAAAAATIEIAAVLVAGAAAFDHSERGLLGGFDAEAIGVFCVGLALLFVAGGISTLGMRLNETMLAQWFGVRAR